MTGQNRLATTFTQLKNQGEKALITYITAGDPDLDTTVDIALTLAESGADCIELGLPFSDPQADGPVIMAATQRALANGANVAGVLETVGKIRAKSQVPLAIMSYYNPIFRYGVDRFAADAAQQGLDALIVPDLPLEEGEELAAACAKHQVEFIYFLAPTSTQQRIKETAARAQGFIYCVSVTGTTGVRQQVAGELQEFLSPIKNYTDTPLVVGFGISTPQQASAVAALADGVIVGSALVHIIGEHGDDKDRLLLEVRAATKALRNGLDGVTTGEGSNTQAC